METAVTLGRPLEGGQYNLSHSFREVLESFSANSLDSAASSALTTDLLRGCGGKRHDVVIGASEWPYFCIAL
jgi:hypothetical protein